MGRRSRWMLGMALVSGLGSMSMVPMAVVAQSSVHQTTQVQRTALQAQLEQGKQQYRRMEFRAAIATYEALGDQPEALVRLGEIYLWIGETEKAEATLKRVGQDVPESGEALAWLAVVMRNRGEYDQALATLDRALELNRGNRRGEALVRFARGSVLQVQGKYAEALASHEQALALAGDDADLQVFIYNWMAIAQLKLKNLQQAKALHQRQQALSRAIGNRLAEYDGLSTLVQIQQDQQQTEQAIQTYQKRAELARLADNPWFRQNALIEIGFIYAHQKQLERGLGFYQQALAIAKSIDDHAIAAVQNRIGIVYYRAQNYPEARVAFQQALASYQKANNQVEIWQVVENIADSYQAQKNYSEAIATYQRALVLAESSQNEVQQAKTWQGIGLVHNEQEDYLQALEAYQTSLTGWRKLNNQPKQVALLGLISDMYILQGWKFRKTEDYAKAEVFGRNGLEAAQENFALTIETDNSDSQIIARYRIASSEEFLGDVFYQTSNYQKALQWYEQALASWQKTLKLAEDIKNIDWTKKTWQRIFLNYRGLNSPLTILERYDDVISLLPKTLEASQKAGDLVSEADYVETEYLIYGHLVNVLNDPERYDQSLEASAKLLAIIEQRKRLAANPQERQEAEQAERQERIRAAQIHQFQGQYSRAFEAFQLVLKSAKAAQHDRTQWWALAGIASIYEMQGNYSEALNYYEQSFAIAKLDKQSDAKFAVQSNIANIYVKRDEYQKAISIVQQHLESAEQDDAFFRPEITPIIVQRICQEADLNSEDFLRACQQRDRLPVGNTLDYFQRFQQLWRDSATLRIAKSHNNLCVAYSNQAEYQKSLEACHKSIQISQKLNDKSLESTTTMNLGQVYTAQGDYRQALEAFQKSKQISQTFKSPETTIYVTNWIANTYQKLGQYERAIATYQDALKISKSLKAKGLESSLLLGLAQANVAQGNLAAALNHYQQSLDITQANGAIGLQARAFSGIGEIYLKQSQPQKALPLLQQALDIQQQVGARQNAAETLNIIGQAQRNQPQLAQASLQQSLAIAQQIGDRPTEAKALGQLAALYQQQNQPEIAIALYKQSVNTYETVRSGLTQLDRGLQQSYADSIADPYRTLAELLLQQNRILEAQRVLDLLKIQELDDYLRNVRSGSNSPGIPTLEPEKLLLSGIHDILEKTVPIGEELSRLRQIAADRRTAPEKQRIAQLEQLQRQITNDFNAFVLSKPVQDLIAQLRPETRDPDFADEMSRLLSIQPTLAALDQNAVLIYPLILPDRIELILTTANPKTPPRRKTIAVSETELRQTIVEFRQSLQSLSRNPRPPAQKLYEWLIKPIEADLQQVGAKTIIYAPDGILRYVPLGALHDGDRWLTETYAINNITATSLTNWQSPAQRQPNVLAGAFGSQKTEVPVGEERFSFGGLPNAKLEIDNLGELMPKTVKLLGQTFNPQNTLSQIPDHNILHLATHGAIVLGRPEQSFILFGNGQAVTIREVQDWNLNDVDLVVLSACETALSGQLGKGEEILGLGYQMQRAGAKATIASLWQVNDSSTQVLMTDLYRGLTQGMTKAEAIQAAQVKMLDANAEFTHPYYWAPFILIGNGL